MISERGYDRGGMAEIAKEAGHTTGAIQGQFGTKANLAAEAARWALREHVPHFTAEPDADELIRWLFDSLEEWFSPTHGVTRKLIYELNAAALATREDVEPLAELCRDLVQQREAIARACLERASQAGLLKKDVDVDALAFYIAGVFPAIGQRTELGLKHPPISDLLKTLRTCLSTDA